MPTAPTNTWSATDRLDPIYPVPHSAEQNVALAASTTYKRGTVLGELLGINAIQTLTMTGSPTGGTFTLTFGGQTTAAIAYNATAATVQAALEALSSIGTDNVAVTGSAGGPWVVTFQNALGYQIITVMTASSASLTGGSTPTLTPSTTTAGSAGTKGTFAPYKYNNSDGSQVARCILRYSCTTDGSGNITPSGEWGVTEKAASVFFAGAFRTQDLVGLDANAVTNMGGAVINGTVASGIYRF